MVNKIKKIALFQIVTIIVATFAFAYLIGETNSNINSVSLRESKFIGKTRSILLNWLSNGLVSAQESLWTCLEDQDGSICQEYPSHICNDFCVEDCFPGRRDDFSSCILGTCLDPTEGTCSPNTPIFSCEDSGGLWSADPPAACNLGCCLIGIDQNEAEYSTEIRCNTIAETTGLSTEWQTVANEIECLILAGNQEEGACVLNENNCAFKTIAECLSIGGEFFENTLCSHPDLNTVCEKQSSVSCIEGKDEVYWLDSCGNRENIYDSNRVRSWNEGFVLSKEDSCSLESGNDPLGNQRTCGNCFYLLGSVCDVPGENDEHIVDSELGDFVCNELSCIDEWGDKRKNGESWCSFDSQIGLDNDGEANIERSVDVPGSRHYRKVCFDNEVRTEPCADFRNEICVENRDESIGFSSSACRINLWQQCIAANTLQEKLDKCENNTDCSLHRVELDEQFVFDACVPKYPPGFDLKTEQGGKVAEDLCYAASHKCTIIEEKKFTGWKCRVNCQCDNAKFTEAMNNLCISVGDCGAQVSIVGEYTDDGYGVTIAPKLGSDYINKLIQFADAKKGQKAEPLTGPELASLFGIPVSTFENENEFAEFVGQIGLGATGVMLVIGVLKGGTSVFSSLGLALEAMGQGAQAFAPGINGFGGVVAGAAVGATIGYLVGLAFGFQGDALLLIVVTGLVSGLLLGANVAEGIASTQVVGQFLVPLIVIIIIVAIIIYLFDLGKTREKTVEFTCLPWQPPAGGANCEECNSDELPCSEYKCQSLGKACEYINEGTSDELCISNNPNDVSPPVILPNEEAIGENLEYTSIQNNGYKIENIETADGCIKEYSPVEFGISLNEAGQCKVEVVHTNSYENMEGFFGGSNLYKFDHDTIIATATLTSLGVSGIDPDRRGEYNIYVRCSDLNGNENIQEYNINLCVAPANDIAPPIINKFIPESPGFAGLNIEEKFVQFYTDEPADCLWSLEDKDFELMENIASCNNNIEDVTPSGWLCGVNLPVIDGDEETDYYFRCKDQPWLGNDDDENNNNDRNVNFQSTVYTIRKSINELFISSITPNDELISAGSMPVSVELVIITEGGVDDTAFCEFNFNSNGEGIFIDFFESGGNVHRQTFSTLFEGEYDISLQCTDIAENVAVGNSIFEIAIDNEGPLTTSVYDLSGVLNVITNEPAECFFDFNSCNFDFNSGNVMIGSGLVHTTQFDQGLIYYTKCKDGFGNAGSCLPITVGY